MVTIKGRCLALGKGKIKDTKLWKIQKKDSLGGDPVQTIRSGKDIGKLESLR